MSMTLLAYSITADARTRERAEHAPRRAAAFRAPAALASPADLSEQFIASARKVPLPERLLCAALATCPMAMLTIAFTYLR